MKISFDRAPANRRELFSPRAGNRRENLEELSTNW